MVYVLSLSGKPLMPTERFGKVRKMLKFGIAKVARKSPFTIQLNYESPENTQDITLGVDAGSKMVGISAVTDSKELFSAEAMLRKDIEDLLSERRAYRRTRRNRKTRYRKARFNNRKRGDKWLAPSIRHKIQSHLKLVELAHKILPISKIIVETASFDIQKIQNPDIIGVEYQHGPQLNFWNVREYVLFRDGHKYQGRKNCKCKILNVHHIESRKTGGDSPGNLITLCETCHNDYHQGKLKLNLKRKPSFKDATFMSVMRWAFYNNLKKNYPVVKHTFWYITKNTRITNGLEKSHRTDALCITGSPLVKRLPGYFLFRFVRKNNRSLFKATLLKGGIRKANKAPYILHGFRLFDKVKYQNTTAFIFGRRTSGSFDIRRLNGEKIHAGINFKKLTLIEKASTLLCDKIPA